MDKPRIPTTGVSGAARNLNWLCYRNAVIDGLRDLGAFCAEGLGVWAEKNRAKIQLRYDLGISPEEAAMDIYEAWPRPYKQDNGIGAIKAAVARAKANGTWNIPT